MYFIIKTFTIAGHQNHKFDMKTVLDSQHN